MGMAVVELGGGRRTPTDRIDMRVGLSAVRPLGTPVAAGDALALVHEANAEAAALAVAQLQAAITINDSEVSWQAMSCVLSRVPSEALHP